MRRALTILSLLICLISQGQVIVAAMGKQPVTTKVSAPPSPTYDTIQVNLWDSITNNATGNGKVNLAGWNEVSIPANGNGAQFSYNLLYKGGTQSGISIAWRLNDKTSRAISAYVDNGSSYASSQTTNFPTAAFRAAGYVSPTDLTYLMIKGLNNAKTYRIEILGSRNTTGTTTAATFSYGATSDNVNFSVNPSGGNMSKVVVLDNLTPTSGAIDILIDVTASTFSFLNAMRIIEITQP